MPNGMVCGIDTGDSTSLASVHSPSGELVDRFEFEMSSSGYELTSKRMPKGAKIACESTDMTYPLVRTLEGYGCHCGKPQAAEVDSQDQEEER